jgi:hypothetical protein
MHCHARHARSGPGQRSAHSGGAAADTLTAADRDTPLDPEDLVRLATATALAGDDDASVWASAHETYLRRGDGVERGYLLIPWPIEVWTKATWSVPRRALSKRCGSASGSATAI